MEFRSSFEFFRFGIVNYVVSPARPYINFCILFQVYAFKYRSFLDIGVLHGLAESRSPGAKVFPLHIHICSGPVTVYEASTTLSKRLNHGVDSVSPY